MAKKSVPLRGSGAGFANRSRVSLNCAARYRACLKTLLPSAKGAKCNSQGNALGKWPEQSEALKARNVTAQGNALGKWL